jgi:hypothetical protein
MLAALKETTTVHATVRQTKANTEALPISGVGQHELDRERSRKSVIRYQARNSRVTELVKVL